MEKILVTGGCGFIGSNFIRSFMKNNPNAKIVNLDKLTYAGRRENLADLENAQNYEFVKGDICASATVEKAMQGCDAVINFAAESHVDRSIEDSNAFVQTNFFGVKVLCEQAKKIGVEKFLQISTDEVYGQIHEGSFTEASPLKPRNPYSAAKAGGELLAMSYHTTHNLPVVVTRSSNNYGPFQFPEKVMPLFITNLLRGKKVPLYGEGLQIRDWLYVMDNCSAIELCLKKGKAGEVYNIGGNCEMPNIELTKKILSALGKGEEMIQTVEDRKGHDFRYSLDSTKIARDLGWKPTTQFEQGLEQTVEWYKTNTPWWETLVK
ncbi:MAG: dTDP-glucose 4,6-dehydratase [Candidatus Diapherotrites archaeon]|nr:dTDP-glucose 4,6-dehydratase [Candidatus Diapherotrites archaeon]